MKDKELREEVNERLRKLEARQDGLLACVVELEGFDVSIKYCKDCKHDTLHERHLKPLYYFVDGSNGERQIETFHRCLNCGADWVYETETVARKYKPLKPKSI